MVDVPYKQTKPNFTRKEMRGDLNETFKMIDGISTNGWFFFNISPRNGNIQSRQISKNKSIKQLIFFLMKTESYVF